MAIERGQVQAKEFTKNGKPKLKIGGQWYFATRIDVSKIEQGQSIEFDWAEFGDPNERTGKRPRGINNFAPLPAGTPVSNGANGHAHPASNLDDQDRPAISNWVAHAIQAGLIKSPTDIRAWALASQEALQALKGAKPAPRQPASSASPQKLPTDFEGDMPEGFYADGPPPEEPPRGTRTW